MERQRASTGGLAIGEDRETLANLRTVLDDISTGMVHGELQASAYKVLKEQLPRLFKHFPCWAVTSLSVGSHVPLLPAIFDLVVIDEASEQRTKETPFRLLSFPFSVPAPKTMPVDIHVRIRPASGMAHMEVKPEDTSFLHGRSVFVDYQTMRPCQAEELITDAKGWPPLEELTPHPAIGIWNGIDELVNEFEQTTPQTKIFTIRLQQMYDFLKTQKPYSFPDGSRVNLPVLNQNGLPGSQVGENLIARFSVALQIHTSKIRSWNIKETRKMITRATWLYGATPKNVNNCIMNYIHTAILIMKFMYPY